MKPFDLIDRASAGGEDPFTADRDAAEAAYNAWLTNRHFSYFPDTVLFANEMNACAHLPAHMQYAFYAGLLRKRKRFAKWHKPIDDAVVEAVSKAFLIDRKRAEEYARVMGPAEAARVADVVRSIENEGVSKKSSRDKT